MQCSGHQDCLFPTACIDEFGWCDLPECTWNGDCAQGQECEPGMRQCQPVTCASTYECANPLEFCLAGACSPPDCLTGQDCQESQYCSTTQGICEDAVPCNEEGACNFYNQVCVGGLCHPNLCATPCTNGGHLCNPKTGKCGAPCTTDGQCPAGWGCDSNAGACYENLPPAAVALVDTGMEKLEGVTVPPGSTVTLDGSSSFDPEGGALTYQWLLITTPPGATWETGTVFCQQMTCPLGPLPAGLYHVGLWVKDAPGATSAQAMAAVHVSQ